MPTTISAKLLTKGSPLILRMRPKVFGGIALLAACLACHRGCPRKTVSEAEWKRESAAFGRCAGRTRRDGSRGKRRRFIGTTCRSAMRSARLKPLFAETVFVDRRVDPNLRVNLDIEASSAEQVVAALAAEKGLGSRAGWGH